VNPRTSPTKLTQVLEAKWREFDSSNPFTKKDDAQDAVKSSESSTGDLRFSFGAITKHLQSCFICILLLLYY